jgi:hypothetical protein
MRLRIRSGEKRGFIRQSKCRLRPPITRLMDKPLAQFVEHFHGKPYPRHGARLVMTGLLA